MKIDEDFTVDVYEDEEEKHFKSLELKTGNSPQLPQIIERSSLNKNPEKSSHLMDTKMVQLKKDPVDICDLLQDFITSLESLERQKDEKIKQEIVEVYIKNELHEEDTAEIQNNGAMIGVKSEEPKEKKIRLSDPESLTLNQKKFVKLTPHIKTEREEGQDGMENENTSMDTGDVSKHIEQTQSENENTCIKDGNTDENKSSSSKNTMEESENSQLNDSLCIENRITENKNEDTHNAVSVMAYVVKSQNTQVESENTYKVAYIENESTAVENKSVSTENENTENENVQSENIHIERENTLRKKEDTSKGNQSTGTGNLNAAQEMEGTKRHSKNIKKKSEDTEIEDNNIQIENKNKKKKMEAADECSKNQRVEKKVIEDKRKTENTERKNENTDQGQSENTRPKCKNIGQKNEDLHTKAENAKQKCENTERKKDNKLKEKEHTKKKIQDSKRQTEQTNTKVSGHKRRHSENTSKGSENTTKQDEHTRRKSEPISKENEIAKKQNDNLKNASATTKKTDETTKDTTNFDPKADKNLTKIGTALAKRSSSEYFESKPDKKTENRHSGSIRPSMTQLIKRLVVEKDPKEQQKIIDQMRKRVDEDTQKCKERNLKIGQDEKKLSKHSSSSEFQSPAPKRCKSDKKTESIKRKSENTGKETENTKRKGENTIKESENAEPHTLHTETKNRVDSKNPDLGQLLRTVIAQNMEMLKNNSSPANPQPNIPNEATTSKVIVKLDNDVICLSDSDEDNDPVFISMQTPKITKPKVTLDPRIGNKITELINSVLNEKDKPSATVQPIPQQQDLENCPPTYTEILDTASKNVTTNPPKKRGPKPGSRRSPRGAPKKNPKERKKRQPRKTAQPEAAPLVSIDQINETFRTVNDFMQGLCNPRITPSTFSHYLGQMFAFNYTPPNGESNINQFSNYLGQLFAFNYTPPNGESNIDQ